MYTNKKFLATSQRVEFINKKKFAKTALDENIKAFISYIAFFSSKMTIYTACKAQITSHLGKNITKPAKYLDFTDVFSNKSAMMLLK